MPLLNSLLSGIKNSRGSLNLGTLASRADQRMISVAGQLAVNKLKSIGRGGGKLLKPTLRVAGHSALLGGLGTLAVGATLGVGAIGLAYGATRMGQLAMGRHPAVTWAKHGQIPGTNRNFHSPLLGRRAADLLGFAGLSTGVAGGAIAYQKSRGWNLSQSMQNGTVEVERDNFMGATGSLTLALHRQRFGRSRNQPQVEPGMDLQQAAYAAARHSDDLAHVVHAVYGG